MVTPDPYFVWPDESKVKNDLASGVPILLPPINPAESAGDQQKRTIKSEWITVLVSQPEREIKIPIVLSGVIVRGPLDLRYINLFTDFSITNSRVDSDVDLSFANFQKIASFKGTEFVGSVDLGGARVQNDLGIERAKFHGNLKGEQLAVMSSVLAGGTNFYGKVALDGLKVEGDAHFSTESGEPATFHDDTSFIGAHIKEQAVFSSVQFFGSATFDLVQIDGMAVFDGALFKDQVSFNSAAIKMQLDCTSARFQSTAHFDGLVVTGDAHFEKAHFGTSPRPPGAPIEIAFHGIRVTGEAKFEDAVFDCDVKFDQSVIEGEALFGAAEFCGKATFNGVHVLGPALFTYRDGTHPAKFEGEVCFVGAIADQNVNFRNCTFAGNLSFQDARFNMVHFREKVTSAIPPGESRQFPERLKGRPLNSQPHIDLRGFSYNRIYVAWEEIVSLLEPFDKQPYRLMEAVFRTMGNERDAGQVYLAQRKRSLIYYWKSPVRWPKAFTDSLYFLLFNFGVRPFRLVVITLVLLGLGGLVFSQPYAVKPKKDGVNPYYSQLTYAQALAVSFNTFMPFEVPLGSDWQPTDEPAFHLRDQPVTYSFLATLLRLTGWIFVPLGAAVFGGLVRRQNAGA